MRFQQYRSALVTGALCCAFGGAQAGPVQVKEEVLLAATPAQVWAVIGDYAGLASWHPAVAKTGIVQGKNNQRGAVREVETRDGARLIESLQRMQPGRSMTYRIVESPLPVSDYQSTLSVQAQGKGSRVIWKSRFNAINSPEMDDAKVKALVAGIYRAGFDGLKERLGGR